MTAIDFDRNNLRDTAQDLNARGTLWFMWEVEAEDDPTDRSDWVRGRCTGFAIDADDNHCLLIHTTNPLDGGRFVIRCIPAHRLVGVRSLGPTATNEGA